MLIHTPVCGCCEQTLTLPLRVHRRHPEAVAGLVLIAPAVNVNQKSLLSRLDLGQLLRWAPLQLLLLSCCCCCWCAMC